MSLFDQSWQQREETIYPDMFTHISDVIYPISPTLFDQLGCDDIDPMWLHYGVFKSAPTATRKTWVYVTSGMSNAVEDEATEYSGVGTEFVLETDSENDLAISILHRLIAFNLLLAVGHYVDKSMLDYGDRIPQPIEPHITTLMLVKPKQFPVSFDLVSGKVDLMQVTGITAKELEFAKENSSDVLAEKLFAQYASYKLQPERLDVV